MGSVQARIRARSVGLERLNAITTWIAVAALTAVGVFAVIAAATIPGKAAASQAGAATQTTSASASTSTGISLNRHDHRSYSPISSSSGPPVVVTGGSR